MSKKIIVSILILILMLAFLQTFIYAGGTAGGASFDFKTTLDKYGSGTGDNDITKPITSIAGTAITVTQVIAVGVAVIMLLVLAMKYMTSAPGDKATIKKHAVVYVVGAVVMFAATGILELIRRLAGVFGTASSAATN